MKTVISASRRTDLPRWFLDDAIKWFEAGTVIVKNPFNQRPYTISLKKEDVHSIVWWSKDFSRFISKQDYFSGFNQSFQFTINGYSNERFQFLEPGMTASLQERLDQAKILADRYRPEAINWRFDPIVFWEEEGKLVHNLEDYATIASFMAHIGIKRNTISFTQWYGKCTRRAKKRGFHFVTPSLELRRSTAKKIAGIAKPLGIKVYACCNEDIMMPGLIEPSACIDGASLSRLFCEEAAVQKDTGQREGCGCTKSKDIGSYEMVCKHGCIYCYANPKL